MQVTFATHNAHKREEVQRIMANIVPELHLVAPTGSAPVEDGASFVDNALIKARVAHTPGHITIAEDSGIVVDALGNEPGIHSARYSLSAQDSDNVDLLLKNLGDTTSREAKFVCAAVMKTDDEEKVVERSWWGTIAHTPQGKNGFGYDPIFIPTGFRVTSAELSGRDKDILSHRGQAFRQIALHLRRYVP